jgi:tight adherence protein B
MIFIGVLVLVEGVYLTVFGKSISLNSRVNRRLEMLDKGASREEVLEKLRKEMNQHLKARRIPIYSLLSVKAQRRPSPSPPSSLMMLMVGIALVIFHRR